MNYLLITSAMTLFAASSLFIFKKKSLGLIFLIISYIIIIISFIFFSMIVINCNLEYQYVFMHTSEDLDILYRVSAVWAGVEGSIFLWLFIYSLISAAIIYINYDKMGYKFLSSLSVTSLALTLLLLSTEPFSRTPQEDFSTSPGGLGLNPLLQTPLMIIHPPLVMLGYAFSMLMSLSVCYSDKVKTLTLLSLFFTSSGIAVGALWAYETLGWGGYWAWDAVEVSSLLPFLITSAHAYKIFILKKECKFPAVFAIPSVMFTRYVTVSGILTSVHSFSPGSYSFSDPHNALLLLTTIITFVWAIFESEKNVMLHMNIQHIKYYMSLISTFLIFLILLKYGTSPDEYTFKLLPIVLLTIFFSHLEINVKKSVKILIIFLTFVSGATLAAYYNDMLISTLPPSLIILFFTIHRFYHHMKVRYLLTIGALLILLGHVVFSSCSAEKNFTANIGEEKYIDGYVIKINILKEKGMDIEIECSIAHGALSKTKKFMAYITPSGRYVIKDIIILPEFIKDVYITLNTVINDTVYGKIRYNWGVGFLWSGAWLLCASPIIRILLLCSWRRGSR